MLSETKSICDTDMFMQKPFMRKLIRLKMIKVKLINSRWFVFFGWCRSGSFPLPILQLSAFQELSLSYVQMKMKTANA